MNKTLYWLPRILSIIFILFLAMFSLDIFGNNYTFWETVLGLLMHNIPSIILAILLVVAWKYEWVGGVAFILGGIFYIIILLMNPTFEWYMLSWSITIAGPAFIIGYLWILNWKNKKKNKISSKKKRR